YLILQLLPTVFTVTDFCTFISLSLLFFQSYAHLRDLHSFPTRRSSDLMKRILYQRFRGDKLCTSRFSGGLLLKAARYRACASRTDRKSTRLNSSHGSISYAVFCLKKKKKKTYIY